jgi:hypothetical protein
LLTSTKEMPPYQTIIVSLYHSISIDFVLEGINALEDSTKFSFGKL